MQQRYAVLLLIASLLFAGLTVFSLCLLEPKRVLKPGSPVGGGQKYGLDAYDSLAGLPIRRRSGGSVLPSLLRRSNLLDVQASKSQKAFSTHASVKKKSSRGRRVAINALKKEAEKEEKICSLTSCLKRIIDRVETEKVEQEEDGQDVDRPRLLSKFKSLGAKSHESLAASHPDVVNIDEATERARKENLMQGFLIDTVYPNASAKGDLDKNDGLARIEDPETVLSVVERMPR